MNIRDCYSALNKKVCEHVTYDQIHNAHLGLDYHRAYKTSELWSKTPLE